MAQKNKPNLKPNILHGLATYNTIFTLSGVNERELSSHSFLTNSVHDIIARTGGIGNANVTTREFAEPDQDNNRSVERFVDKKNYNEKYSDSIGILDRAHDLFIENVNMISTVGPNTERSLGNFTKMEFEVHEPFGITFIEKVRAATAINKYLDYQDAPLLLTIEFKGNDDRGNGNLMPFKVAKGYTKATPVVRKIPILIARVEFDVTEAGAKYNVIAVPYTDLAFDDRYKYPRRVLTSQADNIYEWLNDTKRQLDEQQIKELKEDKTRQIADIYDLRIHPDVVEKGKKYDKSKQSTNIAGAVSDQKEFAEAVNESLDEGLTGLSPTPKGSEAQGNPNIAITKYFEDAVRSQLGYQEIANDFWTAYLRGTGGYDETLLKDKVKVANIIQSDAFKQVLMNNQYVDWFKIKTTVETPNPDVIDNITKMSPKRIIYEAIPFRIHILKFLPPGVSLGLVDWSKKVHKEYDFIYTGDNVDVQGLRINYKTAYYMRNTRADDRSDTDKGLFTHIADSFKEVFGLERDPEPLLPLRQYPSTIKGANTMSTNTGLDNKAQQFYDYLTHPEVDMMRIELDILGDPAYLCQDMYLPISKTKKAKNTTYDLDLDSFNADGYQPIINVRYRLPDDIDEKKGTMFSEGLDGKALFREENLFFNGLYQVNKVDSKFNDGQFTQTLHCSRFNNQQGSGAPVQLTNSATDGLVAIQNELDIKRANDSRISIKELKQKKGIELLKKQLGTNKLYKNLKPN
tara:strand:- start:617 stop:2845 length:2229 start_codon:yes stop_codon:yes gene_type:complete